MKPIVILSLSFLFIFPQFSSGATWYTVNGRYASVEYQAPYDSLAQSLLAIADAEIPRLARLHGLTAQQIQQLPKARIILTDKPDISNGYALGNSVVIYALSSMYLPFWSEQKSWYHLVLTHELTHWVTFKALHRKLSFLGEASVALAPRWFYEGLAQYYAESWNLFRGDYYIKQALLSGRLNANALNNLSDGRLLYASANAFVRYLAFTYGDSSLIRLIRYQPTSWYYDFNQAFKAVYQKEPARLFPDFIRSSVLFYGDFLAHLPEATFPKPFPKLIARPTAVFLLSAADSLYLLAGKEHSIDDFYSLEIAKVGKKGIKIVQRISTRLATQVCVSPNLRYVAYGEPWYSIEADQQALRFQWHIFDRQSKKSFTILKPIRCRYGTFSSENRLVLAEILPNGSRLIRYDIRTRKSDIIFKTSRPVGKLTAANDSTIFFTCQNARGNRQICVLKGQKITTLGKITNAPFSPVFLKKHYLAFNEIRQNQPGIAIYDVQSDSLVSRWTDQRIYWISAADAQQKNIVVYRYGADGAPEFFNVSLDSILSLSKPTALPVPNRYAQWQTKQPLLPDTVQCKQMHGRKPSPRIKHFPIFPMEHLLSFALPFYDKKYGYGFYGSTLWTEILQRQTLAAGFWITPTQPDKSVFLINHSLKWLNTDISTYLYYGPVLLTHPEGTRHQFSFSLLRQWFVKGSKRWRVGAKVAYNYFDHRFKKHAPYPVDRVWFHGPSLRGLLRYRLPSKRDNAIPQRNMEINGFYFTTLSGSNYKFHLFEANMKLGSRLFSDDFGMVERFSLIRQEGHLLPFQIVGIDRYYEFDMPREYLFTRTIRGFRQNIDTDQILWNSLELRYFVQQNTPYKLVFLPVKNVTIDGFLDYARLGTNSTREVASTGFQLSFGDQYLRFSAGYAQLFENWKKQDKAYFFRMAVLLTNLQ